MVAGGDVGRGVAVGGMGVGEGGTAVGGMGVGEGGGAVAGTVGAAVAGTGVAVEPEQAATITANSAKNRVEAHRRLKRFGRRFKMLTLFLRNLVCWWMYPLAGPIGPLGG